MKELDYSKLPEKLFPDEEWRPITDKYIKGCDPYYVVSNYGRIYNWKEERFINAYECNNHFSAHIRSHDENGKSIDNTKGIHRIMMYEFDPVDNMDELEVDHIDNCSYNNELFNMQWLTRQENILKEQNNINTRSNLNRTVGVDCGSSKYSENQVRRVCELLSSNANLNNVDIAKITGMTTENISNIKNRKAWNHISKDYTWKTNSRKKKEDI